MSVTDFVIVFGVSSISSIVGAVIGGVSLVTIPLLILLGLPTHTAIGTDRFGVMGIGIMGWYLFHRKGLIDYKIGVATGIPTLVGSFLGAHLALQIHESALRLVIAAISVLLLPIIVLSPRMGVEKRQRSLRKRDYLVGGLLTFTVGIYGGFYGAMAATFLAYILVLWFSQTFLESAATLKIGSLCMTATAAAVFVSKGAVHYPLAITVFCGCCIGSLIGVHFSVKLGSVWIKRAFILLVLIMIIKLAAQR
jgi:uncharacterized protein